MLILPILNTKNIVDFRTFVDFWTHFYDYPNPEKYTNNISLANDKKSLQQLFEWKNGMPLSKKKEELFTKILDKWELIVKLKSDFELSSFKVEFSGVSAVWKIFLLHCINPEVYPIYDQHIHRAFFFIHGKDYSYIDNTTYSQKEKEEFYFNTYLPFINKYRSEGFEVKKIDEAMFAFGKLLKQPMFRDFFHSGLNDTEE